MIPDGINIAMLRRTNWRPTVWRKRDIAYANLMKGELLPTPFTVTPKQWQRHFEVFDARRLNTISYRMSARGGLRACD